MGWPQGWSAGQQGRTAADSPTQAHHCAGPRELKQTVFVVQEAWAIIGPGGRLHPGWFLEHKGHLVVEGLLIVIIAVMLLQSRFSPKATEDEEGLTEKV